MNFPVLSPMAFNEESPDDPTGVPFWGLNLGKGGQAVIRTEHLMYCTMPLCAGPYHEAAKYSLCMAIAGSRALVGSSLGSSAEFARCCTGEGGQMLQS